jgi:hypothetical protein
MLRASQRFEKLVREQLFRYEFPPVKQGHNGGHECPSCTAPTRGPTELDLKFLDVLRQAAQSARLLAQMLSQSDQQVGVDDVRLRLVGLAFRGLARPSGRATRRAEVDADQPTLLAEEADPLWEITEEGRAVDERHVRVAFAPYDRGVGHDEVDDERDDAGLVVLLVIALLTAVCAAYSLRAAGGVLGS